MTTVVVGIDNLKLSVILLSMFSYKPLADTLKNKSIALKDVAEKAGLSESVLRSKMNNNEYISMKNLDQICNALEIPVDEVIVWKKGEQKQSEKINLNWNVIDATLKDKGMSMNELSLKCRLNKSTLFYAKKRGSQVRMEVVKDIAKILGMQIENLRLAPPEGIDND